MVQLVFTGAIISLFSFVEDLKGYVRYNRWVMWASWGLALVITLVLACCGEIRRKTPHNFIFLGLFTACWSVMLGTTTAFYDVDAILIAVQTKSDFSQLVGVSCLEPRRRFMTLMPF